MYRSFTRNYFAIKTYLNNWRLAYLVLALDKLKQTSNEVSDGENKVEYFVGLPGTRAKLRRLKLELASELGLNIWFEWHLT